MSIKTKIYLSTSNDPYFNLATEDWLLNYKLEEYDHILFLWQNSDSVVIGRSQNPWLECNLEQMTQDNIPLVRRQSGGGAVFHDLGNTNFTFLSNKKNYNKENNTTIILSALKALQLKAKASGRNDIVLETADDAMPRKISGSAFKEKHDRAFHHGTLLINSNLNQLQHYLNPNPKKLEAKGVQSVKSRVINLQQIAPSLNHKIISAMIIKQFIDFYAAEESQFSADYCANNEVLDCVALQQIPELYDYYCKLRSWEWIYGQTLFFTHRFEKYFSWGMIDIQLEVINAQITAVKIYSDSLFPEWIDALENKLKNLPYNSPQIITNLETLITPSQELKEMTQDVIQWLRQEIY